MGYELECSSHRIKEEVTERKQAEAATREARDYLEMALEQSSSGIVIADAPDGNIRMANRAALDIRTRKLGADHPDTLKSMGDLATAPDLVVLSSWDGRRWDDLRLGVDLELRVEIAPARHPGHYLWDYHDAWFLPMDLRGLLAYQRPGPYLRIYEPASAPAGSARARP